MLQRSVFSWLAAVVGALFPSLSVYLFRLYSTRVFFTRPSLDSEPGDVCKGRDVKSPFFMHISVFICLFKYGCVLFYICTLGESMVIGLSAFECMCLSVYGIAHALTWK